MPVFRVHGTTREGTPFAVRFEAPAEGNVEAWLLAEGARAEAVRRLPLTVWPFSRLSWMILVFPVLCYGLYVSTAQAIWSSLDLWRQGATRSTYEWLARDGVTVEGEVTRDRLVSRRGARQRALEYAFVDPAGVRRSGELASLPGDLEAARHDLRLLEDPAPGRGDRLTVTVLPSDPSVHAPFVVDAELLQRFDESTLELRQRLGVLALVAPLLAWMVWNVLVRTGGHFVLSESHPRLVLITRGGNPFAPEETEEDDDDDDGEGEG